MDQYRAEWHAWHDARLSDLATTFGWLSITGLTWLEPGVDVTWDGAPGVFRLETPEESAEAPVAGSTSDTGSSVATSAGWVRLTLHDRVSAGPAPEALDVLGHPRPTAEVAIDGDVMRARVGKGVSLGWVLVDHILYELLDRDGHVGIRRHDAKAPLLAHFLDVPTFPVSFDWVVSGHFEPFPEPRTRRIATAAPGLQVDDVHVGTVTFELAGHTCTLQVGGAVETGLVANFHDCTNGRTTAAWRRLNIGIPDPAGNVILDFNRAINYPCAFTPYATCPAPVPENVVPTAVEAGERSPLQTLTPEGINTPVLVVETEPGLRTAQVLEAWDTHGLDITRVTEGELSGVPPMAAFEGIVLVGSADDRTTQTTAGAAADASGPRHPIPGEELEGCLVDALAVRRPIVAIGAAARVFDRAVRTVKAEAADCTETGVLRAVTAGDLEWDSAREADASAGADEELPSGVIAVSEDAAAHRPIRKDITRTLSSGVGLIEGVDLLADTAELTDPEATADAPAVDRPAGATPARGESGAEPAAPRPVTWLSLAERFADYLRN